MDIDDEPPIQSVTVQAIDFALSPDEERILELYDKLQELRLEISIINAHRSRRLDDYAITSEQDSSAAAQSLLEARAQYKLRNDVVETVMMANPILKAVHNSTEASPIERDLLPYVERRDTKSETVAKISKEAMSTRDELANVRSDAVRACRRNVELTSQLLELTDEAKQRKSAPLESPRQQRELEKLRNELVASRQRWRVVKGVASGVVAGSGVDWARDETLRDVVLDPEEEEES